MCICPVMPFDIKCYTLAQVFLEDEGLPERYADRIAQAIQNLIEDEISWIRGGFYPPQRRRPRAGAVSNGNAVIKHLDAIYPRAISARDLAEEIDRPHHSVSTMLSRLATYGVIGIKRASHNSARGRQPTLYQARKD